MINDDIERFKTADISLKTGKITKYARQPRRPRHGSLDWPAVFILKPRISWSTGFREYRVEWREFPGVWSLYGVTDNGAKEHLFDRINRESMADTLDRLGLFCVEHIEQAGGKP